MACALGHSFSFVENCLDESDMCLQFLVSRKGAEDRQNLLKMVGKGSDVMCVYMCVCSIIFLKIKNK